MRPLSCDTCAIVSLSYSGEIICPFHTGVPTIIRSDCGTENSSLAACHMALRHGHADEFCGPRSFRYGSSTTNTVCIADYGACSNCVNSCDYTYTHSELKVSGDNYEIQLQIIGCICLRYNFEITSFCGIKLFCRT